MVYSVKERDLMNILCFGDSNTWGYKPDKTGRFDEKTRWTGLLQQKLGPEYHIIEEGLCGRTTIFQDELRENRRGLDMVGATVEIHNPIDLMIIMLGTNDCKSHYRASASLISKGLDQVIRKARLNASQHFDLLVISPTTNFVFIGFQYFRFINAAYCNTCLNCKVVIQVVCRVSGG